MSEREIRKLLERACDELDRCARRAGKAVLPGAVGVTLALGGCGGAKSEPTDPTRTDPVPVAQADAGPAVESPPPAPDAAVPVEEVEEERPPYYDIPKPYMAPDAVPFHRTLA
jgi:hypothetical protein